MPLRFGACLHYGSMGRAQSKECYSKYMCTYWRFFVDFHQKSSVFVILISFFSAEVSNFGNRILTNQTVELVVRIRKWICCQSFSENLIFGTLIIRKQPFADVLQNRCS